jgi:hypothetical protein
VCVCVCGCVCLCVIYKPQRVVLGPTWAVAPQTEEGGGSILVTSETYFSVDRGKNWLISIYTSYG